MTPISEAAPRIALIHALEESVLPARAAFAAHWPEAHAFDLLDTSLATDLAASPESVSHTIFTMCMPATQ